jgi:hypothetical protein
LETLRLRQLQQPTRVAGLLEAYISRSGILPKDAYQVRDRSDLPDRVQKVVIRAIAQGQV